MIRLRNVALAAAIALSPFAAAAQVDPVATTVPVDPDATDPSRDTFTIGAGGTIIPRYEGSGDYTVVPGGAIRGRVSGIGFTTVGTALYVDLIPEVASGTKLVLGPYAHLTLNRSSRPQVRDQQIVALGRVPISIDAGANIGISRTGVITSAYDTLAFNVSVSHDLSGIHDSLIVVPGITYGTPLSPKLYVGVTASATHVGDGYAQTYFGVTPAQRLASGLPVYSPGSGFKDVTFGALANASITGDLRGGLSAFAIGTYSKLLGDFGRSPVVADRNQFFGGLGLAYTF